MCLIVRASLTLLLSSSIVLGCSCLGNDSCPDSRAKSGLLFVGTVVSVAEVRNNPLTFLTSSRARIQVKESFAGISADVREVSILTGSGGGDCGVSFQAGEVYLIDASVGKDGLARASICSFTRRLDEAAVALRVLRARRDGQPIPSLVGRIAQRDRNPRGPLAANDAKPLADVLVRVKANGIVYEARADSDGVYAFYELPTGRYNVSPELPAGTKLFEQTGHESALRPADVTAGACREYDVDVFSSGSLQ